MKTIAVPAFGQQLKTVGGPSSATAQNERGQAEAKSERVPARYQHLQLGPSQTGSSSHKPHVTSTDGQFDRTRKWQDSHNDIVRTPGPAGRLCTPETVSGGGKFRRWLPGMQTNPEPSGTSTSEMPQLMKPAKQFPSAVLW